MLTQRYQIRHVESRIHLADLQTEWRSHSVDDSLPIVTLHDEHTLFAYWHACDAAIWPPFEPQKVYAFAPAQKPLLEATELLLLRGFQLLYHGGQFYLLSDKHADVTPGLRGRRGKGCAHPFIGDRRVLSEARSIADLLKQAKRTGLL